MGRNIIAWAKKILSLQIALSYLLLLFSTSAGAATLKFEYDQAGNMISGQGRYYEYNDANQLVKVRKDAPSGPVIAEYVYDYQGQRVKKIENGITTYYIGKHYEERKGNTVNEKTNYIFVNGQRVAASVKKDNEPAKVSYYLNNHLGSADVVVDEQGNVTDKVRYYPYGEYRTQPNAQRHTYTGKERDEATEQYYYEARYYNPFIRRFTQADKIIPKLYNPQSLNRYAYVLNNPIKYIDPTGKNSEDTSDKGFFYNLMEKTFDMIEKIFDAESKIGNVSKTMKQANDAAKVGSATLEAINTVNKINDTQKAQKSINNKEYLTEKQKENWSFVQFFEWVPSSLLSPISPPIKEVVGPENENIDQAMDRKNISECYANSNNEDDWNECDRKKEKHDKRTNERLSN